MDVISFVISQEIGENGPIFQFHCNRNSLPLQYDFCMIKLQSLFLSLIDFTACGIPFLLLRTVQRQKSDHNEGFQTKQDSKRKEKKRKKKDPYIHIHHVAPVLLFRVWRYKSELMWQSLSLPGWSKRRLSLVSFLGIHFLFKASPYYYWGILGKAKR